MRVPQGDIARIEVLIRPGDAAPWGSYRGEPVYFKGTGDGRFVGVLGIDMEAATGRKPLEIRTIRDGVSQVLARVPVEVVPGDFGVQHLTLPEKMVDLDQPTLKRVGREKQEVAELWSGGRKDPLWRETWDMPVDGTSGGSFGKRRVINGKPRSPHNGEDFSAPSGTLVRAPNTGIVRLAKDRYFGGLTVFLEHGGGLFTFYMHLSEISVTDGQRVKAGDVIGRVGQSGRATGPHLHWGGRLGNARINPLRLVQEAPGYRIDAGDGPAAAGP